MRGYIDFMRYGRIARIKAGVKYFDELRAKVVADANLQIIRYVNVITL